MDSPEEDRPAGEAADDPTVNLDAADPTRFEDATAEQPTVPEPPQEGAGFKTGAAPPAAQPEGIVVSRRLLWGGLSAIALIVGSVGPWLTLGPLTVSGTGADGADGWFTLAAGILALGLVGAGRWGVAVGVLGAIAAAVGFVDGLNVLRADGGIWDVGLGWGLALVALSGISLIAWSAADILRLPSGRAPLAAVGVAAVLALTVGGLVAAGQFDPAGDVEGDETTQTVSDAADDSEPAPEPEPEARPASRERGQIGDQIRLEGSDGLAMTVTLERVIDPLIAGEYDEPESGKRYVGVLLRMTNTGDVAYDDSPGNGATLTYGDDREAETSLISGGECSGGFASGTKIAPGSRRKGCVVFEVPSSNTIKSFQLALDSGFADDVGEWNVRPANGTSKPAAVAPDAGVDQTGTENSGDGELIACDQNISAGPTTSCDFAANVFRAYAAKTQAGSAEDTTVTASSSRTGRSYVMDCGTYGSDDVSCTGADGAYITFPKWASDVY